MSKRIFALLIALCLALTFVGCSDGGESEGGGNTPGNVDTSLKDGKPSAPGDSFKLPDIERSDDAAPVIVNVTKQAAADDSILINGAGFTGAKAYVYSQTEEGNGKAYEVSTKIVDDQTMAVTVDKSQPYSLYGVYVETSKGKSNMVLVNKPSIWWIGLTRVKEGQEFSIYGENLTYQNGNKSYVYLLSDDNKYCETEVVYADQYKVTIKIPKLEDEKEYTVRLHNGHGGDIGFVDAEEKITFTKDEPVKFEGKKINVVDFGAKPDDKNNDDSGAIQDAVTSAKDGDIIYFPKGTYKMDNPVSVYAAVKIMGEGQNKSIISVSEKMGDASAFTVYISPTEICDMGFAYVPESATLESTIIESQMDSSDSDFYSLYIHDCKFIQFCDKRYRSQKSCITARGYGVILEDNYFEATEAMWGAGAQKVTIKNNEFIGRMYCGKYYNQNTFLLWGCDMYDICDNKFKSKGDADSGPLKKDDYTIGRALAIQQHPKNMYIANNEILHAGLPDDNAGEQVMFESLNTKYEGFPLSATKDTITMPDDFAVQAKKGMLLFLINGKGQYQVRSVKDYKSKTITVDREWDIIPDSTTRLLFCDASFNLVVHNNKFDGYTNYLKNAGATTAVQAYATIYNMYITDNEIKNMPMGLCISPHYHPQDRLSETAPFYNIFVANNKISNCGIGIRLSMVTGTDKGNAVGVIESNMVIKRNDISKCDDYDRSNYMHGGGGFGIKVGHHQVNGMPGAWIYGNIMENNNIYDNSRADVYFGAFQENNIIRNNTNNGKDIKTETIPAGANGIIYK